MRIVIPAAGKGLRLRPATLSMPKPLIHVGTGRFIDYIMAMFEGVEFDSFAFITGYRADMFEEYMRSRYSYNMEFIRQDVQDGLASAVGLGIETASDNESVLVLLSDTLIRTDINAFTDDKKSRIAVMHVDDPSRFGIVYEKDGLIYDMIEKPARSDSDLAITGLYHFSNAGALKDSIRYIKANNIRTRGEYQITDAMKHMIEQGEKMYSASVDEWIDCGTNDMLLRVNGRLLEESGRENYIDNSEVIDSRIGDNVSVFEGCRITDSVIENSIIGPGTVISSCSLKDSVIGENCNIHGLSGQAIIGANADIKKEKSK